MAPPNVEPSTICVRVGNQIRELRQAKGWSQQLLADHAQIERSHLARLELGERGNPTVNLAGSAISLSVSSTQLNFGTVSSGSTEQLSLTVTNVGLPGTVTIGTTITVSGESIKGHSFQVLTTSENTCSAGIPTGQSCTLPVEFAPTMSGDHADVLTLTPSADGGATAVSLVGTTP